MGSASVTTRRHTRHGVPTAGRVGHHVPMGDLIPLLALIDLGVMVAALYDCITTDGYAMRNLPKVGWILIILLLQGIGGVLWFVVGRPVPTPHPTHPAGRARRQASSGWSEPDDLPTQENRMTRSLAPDDDPDFLRSLADQTRRSEEERLRRWEADLRLREERLRQRENPPTENDTD